MERSWDDYLIPGTDVLRNKITADGEYPYGLDSQLALSVVERIHAEQRAAELEAAPILGQFDYDHMKALHYHLFQDVYDWAGQERTAPMPGPLFKHGPDVSRFPDVDMSDRSVSHKYLPAGPELSKAAIEQYDHIRHADYLRGLDHDEFVESLAIRWGALNEVHSFREGNTRAQFMFFTDLAHHAGYAIDAEAFKPPTVSQVLAGHPNVLRDRFVAARYYYQDFRDAGPLAEVLAQAVRPLTDAERDAHPIVPVEARRARHVASAAFGGGVGVQPSSVQHHAAPPAPMYEPYQRPGYSL